MNKDCFMGIVFGLLISFFVVIAFLFGGYTALQAILSNDPEPHHRIEVYK